jgi:Alpha/beta hydrolase domain
MSILPKRTRVAGIAAAAAALLVVAAASEARVVEIAINTTTSPVFNGQAFGDVGPYEELRGTVRGELDPADRRNAVITDIELASRNANGKVEYTATFTLLKPVDMRKASGVLVYEVNNRGNKILPGFLNVGMSPTNPAGDGFLYRTGNVYLWSGWQGDLVFNPTSPAETIDVPVARNPDGSSVTGPLSARFVTVPGNFKTQSLPGRGRTPASLDTTQAKLISIARESNEGVRTGVVQIPSDDWAFADCRSTPFPGVPDPTRICLRNGFDQNLIYELVYTAKDPLVLGIGMAAMRDVVSFFRHAIADTAGTLNPIAGQIDWVIGYGISQSGRYTKNFILLGFNEDEDGQIVWDGADSNIAGAMGQFNIRFAQPGNIANIFEPGAEAPLWWGDYDDVARGRGVTGILERCRLTHTCPKIFEDFGGAEIWYGRGSVGIAGTRGTDDIRLPRNVRRYYYASTAHGGGPGGFSSEQPALPGLMLARNPNPELETRRALFLHLIDWVTKGTPPPRSRYPRVGNGTLVPATAEAMGWPKIPGFPTPDNVMNVLMDYDYGPDFRYNDESGVMTNVVPPIKRIIPTLAAKVDEDGNEIAGVKSVLLLAPLGTYTSWNPVASGPLQGNEGNLAAGYIPFAKTKAERMVSGDPRRSVEERYGTQNGYVCAVRISAARMMNQRFLLAEDAERLIAQAAASDVLPATSLDPQGNALADRLCRKANARDDQMGGINEDGEDDEN